MHHGSHVLAWKMGKQLKVAEGHRGEGREPELARKREAEGAGESAPFQSLLCTGEHQEAGLGTMGAAGDREDREEASSSHANSQPGYLVSARESDLQVQELAWGVQGDYPPPPHTPTPEKQSIKHGLVPKLIQRLVSSLSQFGISHQSIKVLTL